MFPTLLELAAKNTSDANTVIAQELVKRSDLLKVLQWRSIMGVQSTTQKVTSRPVSNPRGFNQGTPEKKIDRSNVTWKTAIYEERSDVDKALAEANPSSAGGVNGFRQDEDIQFLRSMALSYENNAFNGDVSDDPNAFNGFNTFADQLALPNVVDGGGTDPDVQTSLYMFTVDMDGVMGLYNENSAPTPQMIDMGLVDDAEDADGNKFLAYRSVFHWMPGIRINQLGLGRLANIQADIVPATLLNLMEDLATDMKTAPTAIICNRATKKKLNRVKTDTIQTMPDDQTLNRIVDNWNGIPILISDQITSTQEVVA